MDMFRRKKKDTNTSSRRQNESNEASIASKRACQQHDARGQKKNDETNKRSGTTTQTPEPGSFEREEFQRFHKMVWNRVIDPRINQLKPNSDEMDYIRDIIRISFKIHFDESSKLTGDMHSLTQGLQEKCRGLEEKVGTLTETHEAEVMRKENQHDLYLNQLNSQHQQETLRVRQDHEAEQKRMLGEYNHHLTNMNSRHANDVENLKLRHAHDIRALNNKLHEMEQENEAAIRNKDNYITALERDHNIEMANLEKQSADQTTAYQVSLETTNREHMVELAEMKEEHRVEVFEMAARHTADSKGLREEVHGLKNVLLKRDDDTFLPSMLSDVDTKQEPDEHIKFKFSEIVQMVDRLSRLVWKPEQRIWTDQLLHKMKQDQNLRIIKNHILKDSIWTVLHRYIFCSPFRVFGDEGKNLENEWSCHFPKDSKFDNGLYTWPALGIEVERWRYVTIRECRRALMGAIPSQYDPRAKLKRGFKTTMTDLIGEIMLMLDEMVKCTEGDAQRVEQLAKTLANSWLEFGMHRCRFILFMASPVLNSAKEKARQAEEGNLSLTIIPGLRRHGDIRGVELASSTIVGGLRGEFFKVFHSDM